MHLSLRQLSLARSRVDECRAVVAGNIRTAVIVLSCVALSACAIGTPRYSPQPQVQSVLRNGDFQSIALGEISANEPSLESITIRGTPLTPSTGSFTGDIRQALELELSQAGLLLPGSGARISGTLLKNDLDGRGMSEGHASVSVEFVVHRDGTESFRSTKTADNRWPSSFVGAKAIPAAAQGYVATVEKLVATLVADPAFQKAIK